MERTEKKYFRLDCPPGNLSLLTDSLDPDQFFQVSFDHQPGTHYFIFIRDAELVMARGFARVYHFPYAVIPREEFARISPEDGNYIQRGLAELSPWPAKMIPGKTG